MSFQRTSHMSNATFSLFDSVLSCILISFLYSENTSGKRLLFAQMNADEDMVTVSYTVSSLFAPRTHSGNSEP